MILLTDLCASIDPASGVFCNRLAGHDGTCQALGFGRAGIWGPPPGDPGELERELELASEEVDALEHKMEDLRCERDELISTRDKMASVLQRAGITI